MNEQVLASAGPQTFDEVRKLSKRPWGGPLKAKTCFCCGSGMHLSNHHIEPRSNNGSDSHRNKVTLCTKCHDAVEGEPWAAILARREEIRTERYAQKYERRTIAGAQDWLGRRPLDKIISIRRYCLTRGVLQNSDGTAEDFRQAFRTVNRIYATLNPQSGISAASRCEARVVARPHGMEIVTAPSTYRTKIDRMLWEGTTEQWVAAILERANS